ncbi:zinc-ribbon domain-containing protein [Chloroflexota bacterium]
MGAEEKEKTGAHFCPYCDGPVGDSMLPHCKACGIEVFYCPQCQEPVPRENKTCPNCGTEIMVETE